jgi:hypothetical protein
MAVPQAPMALWRQVAPGTNLTITFTLQGLSSSNAGFTPGNAFNAGNPTCTITVAIPPAPTGGTGAASEPLDEGFSVLFAEIEDMLQKGTATAA